MKLRVSLGIAATLAALAGGPALAADDESLVQILTRADAAHNFAVYCAQYDPSVFNRTKSSVGDMQHLMLHIRSEVISGLPQTEAFKIVLRSANVARAGALLTIRRLYGADRNEERARLHEWCEKSVVPSLREFVAWHDQHHAALDQTLQKAKQGQ